jgi:hypothetical protein
MRRHAGDCTLDRGDITAGPSRPLRELTYHERCLIHALEDEAARFLIVGSWAVGLCGVSVNPFDALLEGTPGRQNE